MRFNSVRLYFVASVDLSNSLASSYALTTTNRDNRRFRARQEKRWEEKQMILLNGVTMSSIASKTGARVTWNARSDYLTLFGRWLGVHRNTKAPNQKKEAITFGNSSKLKTSIIHLNIFVSLSLENIVRQSQSSSVHRLDRQTTEKKLLVRALHWRNKITFLLGDATRIFFALANFMPKAKNVNWTRVTYTIQQWLIALCASFTHKKKHSTVNVLWSTPKRG